MYKLKIGRIPIFPMERIPISPMTERKIHAFTMVMAFVAILALHWGGEAWAQNAEAPKATAQQAPFLNNTPEGREQIHLAALGTYSAGFVLEAYGYIGVLADVLHYGVYEPEIVRSMLGETQIFLEKSLERLKIYQTKTVTVSEADLNYINGIGEILANLITEADSLSNYCQSFDKAEFERFKDSRAKAWAGIKLHLGIK